MVARAGPAAVRCQGSACLLADRRAGPVVPGTPRHHRPGRPLGAEPAGRGRSGAATTGSPAGARPAPAMTARRPGWGFAPQTRTGWAHGPGQDGTIVPGQAVV